MRTFILTILVYCITITTISAQEYGKINDLDKKNGFKSIVLGDTIIKSDKFKFVGEVADGIKTYDVLNIDKKIGNINLSSIVVFAYQNKISKIVAFFKSKNGFKIHEEFEKTYGQHTLQPNRFIDRYIWKAEKVMLIIDYDKKNKEGSFTFMSIPLMELEQSNDQLKLK